MKNRLTWSFAVAALMMSVAAGAAQQLPENTTSTSGGTVSSQLEKNTGSAANVSAAAGGDAPAHQVGGSVQPPVATHMVKPKYSEEARKAKFSGTVVVALIVDKEGKPQDVHVLRSAGMGLDENAVKAVQQYRFKPATQNGKPVAVYLNVQVNFQIVSSVD